MSKKTHLPTKYRFLQFEQLFPITRSNNEKKTKNARHIRYVPGEKEKRKEEINADKWDRKEIRIGQVYALRQV